MIKKKKTWKLWLVGTTVLLIFGFIYVQLSTAYISKETIQQVVFHSLPKADQEVLGELSWRNFKVEKVNLKEVPRIINWSFSQRFHQGLLFLNGNELYKVIYPLANPMYGQYESVIYINPFTRGIVGYAGSL